MVTGVSFTTIRSDFKQSMMAYVSIPSVVILVTNRKELQRYCNWFAGKFTASISDLPGLYGSLQISAVRVIHLLFPSALGWWYDRLSSELGYVFHLFLATISELDVFIL